MYRTGMYFKRIATKCTKCNGRGELWNPDDREWEECPACSGKGETYEYEYTSVNVCPSWNPYR